MRDEEKTREQLLQELAEMRRILSDLASKEGDRDPAEARFRALVQNSSDIITILEADGTIRYESPSIERILGHKPADLVGRNAFDFVHPDDIADVQAALAEGIQKPGITVAKELRFRHADGSWVCMECVGNNRLDDPLIRGIIINSRDITDRRKAEEALRREHDLISRIAETSPEGIIVVDREGRITFANTRAEVVLGLPKDEITRRTYNAADWHITDYDGRPLPDEELPFRRVLKSAEAVYDVRHAITRPDGQRVLLSVNAAPLFDESGRVNGMIATVADITKQVEAEQALRESEANYRLLFSAESDAIITVDAKTREIVDANEAALALYGYSREEFLHLRALELSAEPEKSAAHIERVASGKPTALAPGPVQRLHRKKDGTVFPVEISSGAYRVRDRKLICAIIRDDTERMRAAKALRESERQYRTTLDSMADAIHLVDSDLRILLVNKVFEKWNKELGLDTDFIGRTPFEVFPFLSDAVRDEYRRVFETGEVLITEEKTRIGSREITTETRKIPVMEGNRMVRVITVIRDITERKHMEETLRQNKVFLQNIIDAIQDGISVLDCDLNIIQVNPWHEKMYASEMPLLGRKCFEAYQKRTSPCPWCPSLRTIKTGEVHTEVVPYPNAKNPTGWIELSSFPLRDKEGNLTGVIEYVKDISERRRAEERFRALVQNASDFITILGREGAIRYQSPTIKRIHGYEPEDLVGENLFDYVHEEDLPTAGAAYEEALQQPGHTVTSEFRFRRADDSWAYTESAINNLLDNPIIRGVVVNSRDIEERKQLEARLLQSQKMESVGRLAGGVAHDFNNLLTIILGQADLGLKSLPRNDRLSMSLREIKQAAERGSGLIRKLLAFARRQPLEPRVINLNDVLPDMKMMLERIIGRDIELVTRPAEDLGHVRVDPNLMEQVLVNLAVNARDAMPQGGQLILETNQTWLDQEYARLHPEVAPGEYILLSVSDTGVGMTEEVKAHLFEPFYTTKEKDKGTGLGLATCYGIVSQSGGHLSVESEPGRGTTFKIYLPRTGEEPESPPTYEESEEVPGGTETILLVEDNPSTLELIAYILREQGYTVLKAEDGYEALRVAQEHKGGDIHLLLTDIVMPRMSGIELTDRLQKAHPAMKVLLTSGYVDDIQSLREKLKPGSAFIQKPFMPDSLARKVREVLDR
jgi:PAS domain S-box-containing protein